MTGWTGRREEIPGMAERAAELGGESVVDAVPGRGTTVRLRLPGPVHASVVGPAPMAVR
jgi:signal transduction histidine kinase